MKYYENTSGCFFTEAGSSEGGVQEFWEFWEKTVQ
jgi:hypothetical protein